MPLFPTAAGAASPLLRSLTNPAPPQKSSQNLHDSESSSASGSQSRSSPDSSPPTPPVELELVPLEPNCPSTPPRPRALAAAPCSSSPRPNSREISQQDRHRLADQTWRENW